MQRLQLGAQAGAPGSSGAAAVARSAEAEAAEVAHAQGYALRKRGDFLGAVAAYSAALKLQPHHFKALFNRAYSHDKVPARLYCTRPQT